MAHRSDPGRRVRRSLDGQDPGDPHVAELLARATGSPVLRPEHGATAGHSPDADERRSALAALRARRNDLSTAQAHELLGAAIARLGEPLGVEAIVAWITAVVPPPDVDASGPAGEAITPDPSAEILALLSEPRADVDRGALLALDERRPDLAEWQRHELYLAARRGLVDCRGGLIIPPTRKRILEWIDRVVPVQLRPTDTPTGTVSTAEHPAAREALTNGHGLPPDASGGGHPATAPAQGTSADAVPPLWRVPGRPGWTRDVFEARWREAFAETSEPRTFVALALNFRALDGTVGGVSGDQLRRLRTRRFPT